MIQRLTESDKAKAWNLKHMSWIRPIYSVKFTYSEMTRRWMIKKFLKNAVWSGFEAYLEKEKGKIKIKPAKEQDDKCKKCKPKCIGFVDL